MKKAVLTFAACLAVASTGFSGTATEYSGKTSKEYNTVPPETCFNDTELQIDSFGAYGDTASGQAGVFKEHGWGGGVGLNYFFARYFGLGAEGYWLYVREDNQFGDTGGEHTTLHTAGGSIIARYPIDSLCLAPYVYGGADFHVDGKQWASGFVGGGVEYRVVPHKVGLFVDGRFTMLGDRGGKNDLHFTLVRAGVRLVF